MSAILRDNYLANPTADNLELYKAERLREIAAEIAARRQQEVAELEYETSLYIEIAEIQTHRAQVLENLRRPFLARLFRRLFRAA